MAQHFAKTSMINNYKENYVRKLRNFQINRVNFPSHEEAYNALFFLGELKAVLPGPGELIYEMVKCLIKLFNKIWTEGFVPAKWKT